ncbi:MAG: hypothetical protein Q8893_02660, partial [Candidatus Phytoplasma australasiaticum]|nr:hypothetical protein [Candidatus Phytoplasma australasiaticum]
KNIPDTQAERTIYNVHNNYLADGGKILYATGEQCALYKLFHSRLRLVATIYIDAAKRHRAKKRTSGEML